MAGGLAFLLLVFVQFLGTQNEVLEKVKCWKSEAFGFMMDSKYKKAEDLLKKSLVIGRIFSNGTEELADTHATFGLFYVASSYNFVEMECHFSMALNLYQKTKGEEDKEV